MKYADDCGAILKENMHVFGGGKLEPFHNYLRYVSVARSGVHGSCGDSLGS